MSESWTLGVFASWDALKRPPFVCLRFLFASNAKPGFSKKLLLRWRGERVSYVTNAGLLPNIDISFNSARLFVGLGEKAALPASDARLRAPAVVYRAHTADCWLSILETCALALLKVLRLLCSPGSVATND
jgi:hypothetical protein